MFCIPVSFNGSGTFRGILLQGRLIADDTTPAGTFVNTDSQTEISACSPPEVCNLPILYCESI